jgi:aminoglycoside phosphotransferase (APT) family kinase protein
MIAGTAAQAALEPALSDWLAQRLGTRGPFAAHVITGGNSNETALLTAPGGRWILRRPPAAAISATANDLGREFRVLTALADRGVPAPRPLAYAPGGQVTPRSCLVMEFSDGHPLTDRWPDGWPPEVTIGDAGRAAVEALAALHRVDYAAAGLADFGRPAGYLRRQVARWRGQYEQNRVRDLPLFGELGDWLESHRPAEAVPAILHGDFHLDNCLIVAGPPARVSAVIDWELATIGDPLLDLAGFLRMWLDSHPPGDGWPTRAELVERYSQVTGSAVPDLMYHEVLARFRLAVSLEGIYQRSIDDPTRAVADDMHGLAARLVDELGTVIATS